ncbi:MAG: CAAX prenyl protease-related protein [Planctomycetia bacterium]|nr:CAAX prenyl protease-related protein [Planctomycetia bacterium]
MDKPVSNVRTPGWTLLLPFLLFMIIGGWEPTSAVHDAEAMVPYRLYPLVYSLKIAVTTLAVLVCFVWWRKEFPLRFTRQTWLAVLAGAVGFMVWVGVCHLNLEKQILAFAGQNVALGVRSGYNPFVNLSPDQANLFWIVRLIGLALVVPIMEEFFLRGFLLRYVLGDHWQTVPFGTLTPMVWGTTLVYAAATHPGEAVAAILWFSAVTWFSARTRNIWDAVVFHAVTNLLLGLYVFQSGEWMFL